MPRHVLRRCPSHAIIHSNIVGTLQGQKDLSVFFLALFTRDTFTHYIYIDMRRQRLLHVVCDATSRTRAVAWLLGQVCWLRGHLFEYSH